MKNYSRKHSCNNNRPFDINFLNTNNIKIINRGSNQNLNLNKLIINNNDKTPEKKRVQIHQKQEIHFQSIQAIIIQIINQIIYFIVIINTTIIYLSMTLITK